MINCHRALSQETRGLGRTPGTYSLCYIGQVITHLWSLVFSSMKWGIGSLKFSILTFYGLIHLPVHCQRFREVKPFAQGYITNNEQSRVWVNFPLSKPALLTVPSFPRGFVQGLRVWILEPAFLLVNPGCTYPIFASMPSSESGIHTCTSLIGLLWKLKDWHV